MPGGEGFWQPMADVSDLAGVDVTTAPPTDGQALVYDAVAGEWVPGSVITAADVRDAGRWEVVVTGNPAEAVTTPDGTDWVYAWVES